MIQVLERMRYSAVLIIFLVAHTIFVYTLFAWQRSLLKFKTKNFFTFYSFVHSLSKVEQGGDFGAVCIKDLCLLAIRYPARSQICRDLNICVTFFSFLPKFTQLLILPRSVDECQLQLGAN